MTATGRHIAIVTSGLGAGGAERVISLLASHLIANGNTVSVVTFDRHAAPIFHPLPPSVALHRLGVAGPMRRVAVLRRRLAAIRPDLVVSLLTKINAIALVATVGLKPRVIACERNNPERQHAHPAWNAALRLLYRRATTIVCQTEASRRCLPHGVRDRVVVIPNPIEPFAIARADPPPPRLVAVGRLTHQKGFDLLIAAFARIAARHPNWRLDIWGEGEDRERLQQLIDDFDMADRIALPGLSAQPGGWLADAGAMVLSSRYEGFPNVLAEAMAAGLPVIASDCAFGPAELIEPERTGLLVPPEDVAALATGLDRLLGDPALRDRLGIGAQSAAVRFAAAPVLTRWERLIGDVLEASTRAARLGVPHIS
ncbi:MAG TPA: glycosyltransferase family 4 protein [Sphingomonas sp.]|nr:glycosyltransferase family 4 protein [Sphingomonas sp.]